MDIVGKARRLERRIARSVDAAVGGFLGEPGGVSALEIVHAVVDAAEQQVQEAGRGRRLFPFNRVVVYIPAGARDKQARARFAAVAAGPPSLTSRLRERLEAAGCKADDLSADVVFVAKPQPEWRSPDYHVDFERGRAAAPPPPEPEPQPDEPPRLRLTVTAGSADRKVLLFDGGRVDIGRRAEVVDAQQRLVQYQPRRLHRRWRGREPHRLAPSCAHHLQPYRARVPVSGTIAARTEPLLSAADA